MRATMRRIAALFLGLSLAVSAHAAARFFATDSGGTPRQVKRLFVVDSGGTSRQVKRLFVVDSGGTARLVCCYLLTTTMTVGNDGSGTYGYVNGSYGSMTSASLVNGNTVSRWQWDNSGSGFVLFRLSGTGIANSDATFASIQVGTHTVLARSSATYTANDSLGNTQWAWAVDTSTYPTSSTTAVLVSP